MQDWKLIDGPKLQGVENDGHSIKRIIDARARTPWPMYVYTCNSTENSKLLITR